MRATAEAVLADDGGVAVAHAGGVAARLPLAVGGVMSAEPTANVVAGSRRVREALEAWGWRHANPFMSVSTLTLAVSPSVKITDLGLVDVLARDGPPKSSTAATDRRIFLHSSLGSGGGRVGPGR
ncbi:adenine deaminase C-terminal domain-containing protein [Saccharopolyspora hattusasensis]|uniref:adenine deaminase C-terminal domain-containing protein n=1 Tax=Saccharopolyspora hattusasensis TaxID=1128679 RepID=UPI003D98EAE6